MPNPKGYSGLQIGLHWIIAVLIIPLFLFTDPMERAWHAIQAGTPVTPGVVLDLHIYGGYLVLALVVWRYIIRLTRGVPLPPREERADLKKIAHYTHLALYATLVLMPITGAIAWYSGSQIISLSHDFTTTVIIWLIVLHVAGALYHQYVLKNNLIARMMRAES